MRVEDPVAVQYSRWPYPDAAVGLEGRLVWNDPAVYAPLYWPDRAPPAGLEVLIAGCGTAEAAALAARNPTARVLGVDISGPAIASQRALVERYGLRNVELRECAVEDVATLGRTFDFISVAGVLHHLADPAAGLRALGAVLRPEGVISGAVYARHARAGLGLLHHALAAVGAGHDAAGLAAARALLSALPAHHPATQWMARTGETGAREAHLVDAFLPAREATFTADGVLALVEAAGLAFQGWLARGPYEPDGLFSLGHPLGEAFAALPDAERFAAMAALTVPLDHWFLACRRDRDPARYQLDFGAADLLDWVPGRRFPPAPRHPPLPYDPRDPVQEALYRPIDGQRRLGECLAAAGLSGPPAAMHDAVRRFIAHLWRKDAVFLRLPRRSP